MIEYGGWHFPDGEKHLPEWLASNGVKVDGRLAYQYKKLSAAISYCKTFRNAVDVGAHIGLWTYYLASKFAHVDSFEPVAAHRECFTRNIEAKNVTLHACALGEEDDFISITTAPTSSGDSRVDGPGEIPMKRLDDFKLQDVDFMKLDCEGAELFVLKGGERTIRRCRPVICVEQKPGRAQRFGLPEKGAVEYLQGMGYKMVQELSGDFILTL